MIVSDLNPAEVRHLRHALTLLANVVGEDRVPPRLIRLREQLGALSNHTPPQPAARVDPARLVSYGEAADALGVSARTISRMVADGKLSPVGRRIPAHQLLQIGETNGDK